LYNFLENKSGFSHWIRDRISQYGFIENVDYYKLNYDQTENSLIYCPGLNNPANNSIPSNKVEYVITINMAKELAMVERNEKGKQARRYFIECEEKFLALKYHSNHLNPEELKWKKWEFLSKTLERITDEKQIKAVTSAFLKEVTGDEIVPFEKQEKKLLSATEVCSLLKSRYGFNISRNLLGRLANKYDLKREEFGEFIHYTSRKSENLDLFRYYENAVAKFKEVIQLENKFSINL
jgi:antA/antB antirepressor domain protein